MNGDRPISWLMFFTFAASIFNGAGAFTYFLRSRRNRNIASEGLAGADHPRGEKGWDGAVSDLLDVSHYLHGSLDQTCAGAIAKRRFPSASLCLRNNRPLESS